jgi:hypothetical protein
MKCPKCKTEIKEYYRLRFCCQFTGKEKTMWIEK